MVLNNCVTYDSNPVNRTFNNISALKQLTWFGSKPNSCGGSREDHITRQQLAKP